MHCRTHTHTHSFMALLPEFQNGGKKATRCVFIRGVEWRAARNMARDHDPAAFAAFYINTVVTGYSEYLKIENYS